MKIYFLTKKKVYSSFVLILLLAVFIVFGYINLNTTTFTATTGTTEAIFQGNSGEKVVAITVNVDWGEEFIPDMLKNFKSYDAKATFFVTGKWAEKNEDLLKEMQKDGHSIQNHGYKHLHFNNLGSDEIKSEIKKAEDIIYDKTGEKTTFFASPYGEYNQRLVSAVTEMEYKFIMWSVDTIDWQKPNPETIIKRVMNKVHNDAIILMHPTDPTVKALPNLLKQLKDQGYKMMTIDKIVLDEK
ncbi:polysaccharide deacetylase, putative [Candidatus Syntrophocurvum alkaliphilum]|uniref:Polysaccharide deacetylase, putative n=1 Tax=Candidatus Syntrophocurvum alkaliphilum TaxID=2293317 RepID=A0A6I6DFQ6_9FIRM|nr:polysaccharide deacetylase family protein [Candidatus Syntrophocurvum alkaliphilum]QGT99221.1 polysaccharide deacetylase, putative [Candidatus Syntrophocurvum alkaliphilum]